MLKFDIQNFRQQLEKHPLIKNLKKLSGKKVEIGYFNKSEHPVNQSSIRYAQMFGLTPPKPINMATLARCMNYGTAGEHAAPARPFFDNAYAEIRIQFKKDIKKNVFDTNFYDNFGKEFLNSLYNSIDNGSYTKLAPITIYLKGHDKPLIGDSGLLIAAGTYEVT
jgi:hypothetical protein